MKLVSNVPRVHLLGITNHIPGPGAGPLGALMIKANTAPILVKLAN